jgi:alkylated DNA repair dioxygenase AlkB
VLFSVPGWLDSQEWNAHGPVSDRRTCALCCAASASFGARRDFVLRRNERHDEQWSYPLGCGDVLVMLGTTQDHWMHSVPKRVRLTAPRVNLTFRTIVRPEV